MAMSKQRQNTPPVQELLPFRNLEEWLKWKNEQLSSSHDIQDETADDDLFADPQSAWGIGGIFEPEARDRPHELNYAIGKPETLGCTSNGELFYRRLGMVIVLVQLFKGKIDIDRLGVRVDSKKHMIVDAISILLRELKVQSHAKAFIQSWRKVRHELLVDGSQLKESPGRRGEDRGATVFLKLTYWLFKRHTNLPEKRIKYFQKIIMTQCLLGDGIQLELVPCRYELTSYSYFQTHPTYRNGVLLEVVYKGKREAHSYHPGKSVGSSADCYSCKYYRKPTRTNATHCKNGNICKFVDQKVDAWYRHAKKIGLLKNLPSNFESCFP